MSSPRRPGSSVLLAFALAACGGSSAPPETAAAPEAPPSKAEPAPEKSAAKAAPTKATEPAEQQPESIVGLSFEPLVLGVRPGQKLMLAAHFKIAPGYRISWKAPGEVGQPTSVTFRAPPGFVVGDVQFPAPVRYTVGGGYTGYGYEKETAIFVEVKAPATLRRDDVSRFDLDASWVACRRICATERTSAFVELATTYGDARAKEIEDVLSPFRARLPRPLDTLKDAEAKWDTAGKDAVLRVSLPGATPKEFFSDGTADPKPKKTKMADGQLEFVFDDAPKPGSRPLRGVVVATLDQKEAFFDVEAPLPGEEPAAPEAPTKAKMKKRR